MIQTEASALQNIADTANRLVARLDQVLSDENVKRIAGTLENIERMTGVDRRPARGPARADRQRARSRASNSDTTLVTTNRAVADVDRELVQKLPGLIAKLDSTLA